MTPMMQNAIHTLNALSEGRVQGGIMILEKLHPEWTKQQIKDCLLTTFTIDVRDKYFIHEYLDTNEKE